MAVNLSLFAGAGWQFFTDNGIPLSGGLLYTYTAGSTTPETTYADNGGATQNANPIVLDAAGRPPSEIWLSANTSYKFVVKTSTGTLIRTYDDIPGANDVSYILDELANTSNIAQGDALVGFKQANANGILAGAVGKTVHDKLTEFVSIKDFGGIANGSTNNASALQAAHDALGSNGGSIYFPAAANSYAINSNVTFTKPVTLLGDGWYSSQIITSTANLTLISTNTRLNISGFSFTATNAAVGTCKFVLFTSPAVSANHSTIENSYFFYANIAIHDQSTTAIYINNNQFYSDGVASIYLENLVNSDQGDSFITNNTIAGSPTTVGIYIATTSGLYISNNKFLNEKTHIAILPTTYSTGVFLFSNNSFEGHTDYAIQALATTGNIVKTLVTGNQFSSVTPPIAHIYLGNLVQQTLITGNVFTSTVNAGVGISIDTGSRHTSIVGNQFFQLSQAILAAASSDLGLTINANRFDTENTSNEPMIYFSGETGSSASPMGMDKQITATRYISNNTPLVYTDVFKVQGNGVVEINVYGTVQGVASCNAYTKVICLTSTPTNIIAPVTAGGQFDLQVASSGGYLVISVRQHIAVGSALTAWVQVTVSGNITYFAKP